MNHTDIILLHSTAQPCRGGSRTAPTVVPREHRSGCGMMPRRFPTLPALRTARHPLVLAVASALALVALPAAAQSQWGVSPATTVNSTQINFAGHEWVVIGKSGGKDIYQATSGGVSGAGYGSASQPSNSVTLLLNHDGNSTPGYEAGGGFPVSGAHLYQFRASTGGSCYSSTYAGSCNTYPNEYNDSDLQKRMAYIANNLPGKEQGVINERSLQPITGALPSSLSDLNANDGINGASVSGQKLWALSYPEWLAIADNDIRTCSRSPKQ